LDIISKLQIYKENRKTQKPDEPNLKRDVSQKLGGTLCSNIEGSCCVIENVFPLSYLHGGYRLGDILEVDNALLNHLNPEASNKGIEKFLFVDTETTGLGGAGTVAFLIGVGFFNKGSFVLRQYFMRDYDDEPSVLEELNTLFKNFCGLVSFNGKAFDWNLIESRFIFNRMKPIMKSPIHLDLLYPSRRIWKLKLESCRLTSLEENILGEYRVNDIPGELIPSVYFKFLESGDTTDIKRVISHNRSDIISMISLLVRILSIVDNPMEETDGSYELLGAARIFEACEEKEMVVRCYEECMKNDKGFLGETAAKKLGSMYKRNRDYNSAIQCWEFILENKSAYHIPPLIELAKYYEHKARDYGKALDLTQKALDICLKRGYINNAVIMELRKRMSRLMGKIERAKNA